MSDKIFKPETFSAVGWEIIQNTKTLAELVNRNVPAADPQYQVTFNRSFGFSKSNLLKPLPTNAVEKMLGDFSIY